MKILGTGLSGLVGSRIVEILSDRVAFESSDVDITHEQVIKEKIESSNAPIVLHLAAKASVDGCELDKDKGGEGDAWKINVLGTKYIAEACLKSNKKLIYISTDFVFDGESESYDENSVPNPIDWYGVTKLEGEKLIQEMSGLSFVIARIAYPYRAKFERNDFFRAILERLKNTEHVLAISDHIFTPTFVDNIAEAIFSLVQANETGIFHVVGNRSLSPYDAALCIAKKFGFETSLIQKTTREEYFKNRAKRPFRLMLRNDKITKLGVKMSSFEEGLERIQQQL